jgi:ketosteroid isomerase-like protein
MSRFASFGNITKLLKRTTVALLLLNSCSAMRLPPDEPATALDRWHEAAARADIAVYIGLLTEDAIFLGTDARERWTRSEFAAFVEPYFSAGRGWTYRPQARHIHFSADARLAWFDERLANEEYGELRGTGVLRRTPAGWRIAQYSLSFTVPNSKASEVVRVIRGEE